MEEITNSPPTQTIEERKPNWLQELDINSWIDIIQEEDIPINTEISNREFLIDILKRTKEQQKQKKIKINNVAQENLDALEKKMKTIADTYIAEKKDNTIETHILSAYSESVFCDMLNRDLLGLGERYGCILSSIYDDIMMGIDAVCYDKRNNKGILSFDITMSPQQKSWKIEKNKKNIKDGYYFNNMQYFQIDNNQLINIKLPKIIIHLTMKDLEYFHKTNDIEYPQKIEILKSMNKQISFLLSRIEKDNSKEKKYNRIVRLRDFLSKIRKSQNELKNHKKSKNNI